MPVTTSRRRRHLTVSAALAVIAASVLAACGSDPSPESSDPAPSTEGGHALNRVSIRLISFRPSTLEVGAGTTVTWTQEDAAAHTITSGVVEDQGGGATARPDGRFDSGEIETGKTFSLSLDQPGTYPYFCALHPATMRGELRIT